MEGWIVVVVVVLVVAVVLVVVVVAMQHFLSFVSQVCTGGVRPFPLAM